MKMNIDWMEWDDSVGYEDTEWNGFTNVRVYYTLYSVCGMEGATSAPVLAGGMNAGSQWHKSTFCRPDRDGLHPPSLFSNDKKEKYWVGLIQNFTFLE